MLQNQKESGQALWGIGRLVHPFSGTAGGGQGRVQTRSFQPWRLPAVLLLFRECGHTSGHFVHKSERRTRDGGFHIPAAVLWKQADFLLIPIRKNSACFPAGANGAQEAPHPVSPVSHASRYNTLHSASKVVCQRGHPFGNPRQQNRRYAALSGSIPPFVVSSPFHGLRVVPCKLT